MSAINLAPFIRKFSSDPVITYIQEWLSKLNTRIGNGPFKLAGYSVTALPSASDNGSLNDFTSLIYIYDEVGGATLAFSDGTNWRRVQDRAIVS